MTTSIKTPVYRTIVRVLASLFIICLFFGCKDESQVSTTPTKLSPELSSYIYAYTSGVISREDPILVRFIDPVIPVDEIGRIADSKLVSFSPGVQGELTWEDDRTLKFEPGSILPSKTVYKAKVRLNKIFNDVPSGAGLFEFDFRTKEQYFDISFRGLKNTDDENLSKQEYEGTIKTSDFAEIDKVEKLLTASQKGNKDIDVEWQHSANQRVHNFTLTNIKRGDSESKVLLSWNGKGLGVEKSGKTEIEVPKLGDFKITDVQVIPGEEAFVLLSFSDPLKENQNLDGLIKISGYNSRMTYSIDGNQIRVYPSRPVQGERNIEISDGIRNSQNFQMKNPGKWEITFAEQKPQVRLVGKGAILPSSEGLIFPFEAVSLNAVDVEILKIYENNILQFLQSNQLEGNYDLERVGKVILQRKIDLAKLDPSASFHKWTRYALDMGDLVDSDPNAIYQVRIGFKMDYKTSACANEVQTDEDENLALRVSDQNDDGEIESFWDGYRYWNYPGYRWSHRKDPCYPPYYSSTNFVRRNIVASDLGIVAKKGNDGTFFIAVSDIVSTQKLPGVKVSFLDYQQQLIATATTDGEGMAQAELDGKPYFIIAEKNNQRGYIKLDDGSSLSLSRFDVAGVKPQKGLKGFIYGERGVWRPGDSIYLNFILEDKTGRLPANHPVTFEFYDPRGQIQQKRTTSKNINNVFSFHTATNREAPTGNWQARVKVGGAVFSKTIKVETVKPNRLKINLDFGKDMLVAEDKDLKGTIQVNWLHGAPAQNLKSVVEVQLNSVNTTFPKYSEYEFDDPARKFSSEPQVIFDKNVNADGFASIQTTLNTNNSVPGKLRANFKTRAFEKGGDFSIDNFSMPFTPYNNFTGIRIPKDKWGSKRLEINSENTVNIVVVDSDGNPVSNTSVSAGLYRVNWRWWWDRSDDQVTSFNSATHTGSISKQTLSTDNKGQVNWNVKPERWGRYMIRVCDNESGHCTGDFFYAGYPWYDSDDDDGAKEGAAMLVFTSDKKKYEVGETVQLEIPSGDGGRALVSLENGSGVVESYWVDTEKGETKFRFYATEAMSPTVYANVTLIQPHAQKQNDLPIRMYGVIPITVEDPKTKLEPKLKVADVLKPEEKFKVTVSETKGKPMVYTVAIVDDGLLDLTRFKTPDPWNSFYAREALGVKTWDVYDHVLGAYGGDLERILSIGGDAAAAPKPPQKANRFKPVVKHLGPFYLPKGKSETHEITMPNYVGSVRAMVVAAEEGAYGMSEKTIPVRKPLMILGTLPRVLGPGESVELPVNVFAMEKKVKNVKIKIETNDLVSIDGPGEKNLSFNRVGDQIAGFNLKVNEGVGIARVKITATGAGETATQEIELDVRNPNPYVTNVVQKVIQPGETWTTELQPAGLRGTNTGILEVSNLPPINLGERLNWLIRYPHGCIEQTTSSGFPQLFVNRLLDLPKEKQDEVSKNIEATVERLKLFQTSSGGFSYWPGNSEASEWGSNYGGHFMLEAKALGYSLPPGMLDRWKKHQKKVARNWTLPKDGFSDHGFYNTNDLMQAYRLYTLALAGAPELGAMNRMREMNELSAQAKWRLAAAYQLAGKKEAASALVKGVTTDIKDYVELSRTYGSATRDRAMICETMILMNDETRSAEMSRDICEQLSSNEWLGTQTIAYSLLAVGKYMGETDPADKLTFTYSIGNQQEIDAGSDKPVFQTDVQIDNPNSRSIQVNNPNQGVLYARVILTGQPLIGDQSEVQSKLGLKVTYKSLSGEVINPEKIEQGTDFIAEVAIKNPGTHGNYEEMALNQVFPSGWEIHNSRMDNIDGYNSTTVPEYQDIRDDRVYSYFDIRSGDNHIYRVQLNAAYKGRFYLPTTSGEAMYDNTINARVPGKWVEVVGPNLM